MDDIDKINVPVNHPGVAIWSTFSAAILTLLSQICLADTVVVNTVDELQSAVSGANNNGGDGTILVADGIYTLSILCPSNKLAQFRGRP